MVARSNMYGPYGNYGSYSYRLWSLANVWSNYHFSLPKATEGASSESAAAGVELHRCPQCHRSVSNLRDHVCITKDVDTSNSAPCSPLLPIEGAPTPTPGGAYVCQHCSAAFSRETHLQRHEQLLHSPNALATCKICRKTFANVYRLQRHEKSHEENEQTRRFKCPECEKAFKFKHHLKEHTRIHSGEKPYACNHCGKRFSHSGSYSSHTSSKKCLISNVAKAGRGRGMIEKSPLRNPGGFVGPKRLMQSPSPTPSVLNFQTAAPPSPLEAYLRTINMMCQNGTLCPPFPTGLLQNFHPTFSPPSSESIKELPALPAPPPEEEEKKEEISPALEEVKEEVKMKEEEEGAETPPPPRTSSCESSASRTDQVKSLLQTVGTSVTKERLEVNMQKLLPPTPSPPPPQHLDLPCKSCGEQFSSPIELHQHQTYLCEAARGEEGLAAKLEASMAYKSESGVSADDCSDYARDNITDDETGSGHGSGRKVRVRSLIGDAQLNILKLHYANNPKPKKEELGRIADQIGFSIRVVQVWFQNTRARDRREGRFLVHPPYYNGISSFLLTAPPAPSSPNLLNNNNSKCLQSPPPPPPSDVNLPLDLSTKKSTSSQCSSPSSDSEECAMNLSHKSSRSPTPSCQYRPYADLEFHHQNYLFRNDHSPAPAASPKNLELGGFPLGGRLQSILSQPTAGAMFGPEQLQLLAAMNGHASSRKRSWKPPALEFATGETMPDDAADDSMGANSNIDPRGAFKKRRITLTPPRMTSAALQNHIGGVHTKATSPEHEPGGAFTCDQCEKSFNKASSLQRHKYEHSGQRPHICETCGKAFKHKHHLTEHTRLHTGEKPFECDKCLKRFSHSGSYSQHKNHRYSYCKPYRD